MTSLTPWIQRLSFSENVLRDIYASDQDMYPAPLTYERLQSWVAGCPELSICFEAAPEEGGDAVLVGAIIVLPILRKHWEQLLAGTLKETDVDPKTMFAADGPADVGLHVFHIERFDNWNRMARLRHFAEFALEDTRDIVKGKNWNVLGYSAGRAVCKRMGFKPTGYEEIFMTSEATGSGASKIEMVCVYPDQSEPRDDQNKEHLVLGKSQMVVLYLDGGLWDAARA